MRRGRWLRPAVFALAGLLLAGASMLAVLRFLGRGETWYLVEVVAEGEKPVPFFLGVPNAGDEAVLAVANKRQHVRIRGRRPLQLRVPVFGSEIELEEEEGGTAKGRWRAIYPQPRESELRARRVAAPKSELLFPGTAPPVADLSGAWRVEIDTFGVGRAVFRQKPNGDLEGTLIPPEVGDTRLLSGRVIGDRFYLSSFDGMRAYLVTGAIAPGGTRLQGVWTLQAAASWNFRAVRGNVPALSTLVSARLKPGHDRVTIPELEDARFRGQPVLVDFFGTWCPACMDLTPQIVALKKKYGDDGLKILSIAFEPSDDDKEATKKRVEDYRARYGVSWDIQIRYMDDFSQALPPELDSVLGFPLTIFIRRDGTVAGIHTAFVSDAARPEHKAVVDQFQQWAQEIVKSKPAP